jgi:uncharacterized protein YndB with AHSA1/START domain
MMSEATLAATGPRPILRFERHLPASIDEVWTAVTDPLEMRSWFPTRIEMEEWKVGATLTHHFEEHGVGPLSGIVLEWDPPHRVSFTWDMDTITFELTAAPQGGTIFVLTEQLAAERAARNAAGWESCLDRLQFERETETWTTRFDHYSKVFEPVLGPQEGPPKEFDVS